MAAPIVGIDLGTTNSVVAATDQDGYPLVLADDSDRTIHPSVVSFHPNGSVLIGADAKPRRIIDAPNTIYAAKRLLGRTYRTAEVVSSRDRLPYAIREGVNEQPVIVTRAGEFAVPEIAALIIDHLKGIASASLGATVDKAVVTVPANFNEAQRSATATAGAIAGISVVRVLNEPSAAALAYGFRRSLNATVAVYDFGGGTFDISVLRVDGDVYEVLGTAGNSFLGGEDIDERLVNHMVAHFLREKKIDLNHDAMALQRLRIVAEQIKIELARRTRALVKVDEIAYGPGGAPFDLELEVTRNELDELARPIVDTTFQVCDEALRMAGMAAGEVGTVILVGGSTRMLLVRELATSYFRQQPRSDVSPELAVAEGAALQAYALGSALDGWVRPTARHSPPPSSPPMPPQRVVADADGRPLAASGETAQTSIDVPRLTRDQAARPETDAALEAVPSVIVAEDTLHGDDPKARESSPAPSAAARQTDRPAFPSPDDLEPTNVVGNLQVRLGEAGARSAPPDAPTQLEEALDDDEPTSIHHHAPAPPAPPVGRNTLQGPVGPGQEQRGRPGPPPPATLPPPSPPAAAQPPASSRPATLPPPSPRATALPPPPLFGGPNAGATPLYNRDFQTETGPGVTAPSTPAPSLRTPPPEFGPPSPPAAGPAGPVPPPRQPSHQAPPGAPGPGHPPPPVAAPAPPPAPLILDVTPHSLCLGTVGGYCEVVLARNSRVPAEATRAFTASRDGQQIVRIRVCQGESRRLDENFVLGDLILEGLPPRSRGDARIQVTFAIDENGMLHVRAVDENTGNEQRAVLQIRGRLSPEEIAASRQKLQMLAPPPQA